MRMLRIVGLFVVALVFLALAALVGIFLGSERMLAPRALPSPASAFSAAGGSVARGEHIASSYGGCRECHGPSLGGRTMIPGGPMGTVAAPNLTRGTGGVGGALSDADFERAIRSGLRPDGTGLLIMPASAFSHLSDGDVRDVIAYVRSVPPVDAAPPARVVGPLARFLIATGKMHVQPDLVDAGATHLAVSPAGVTLEHGAYLARVGGCMECHGANLGGGHFQGSPKDPPATNLTRGAIGSWTQADFVRTLRTGRDPLGHMLDPFMPWRAFGQMNDDELAAIWLYLRSVPPIKS